jgi:hypothetical protein
MDIVVHGNGYEAGVKHTQSVQRNHQMLFAAVRKYGAGRYLHHKWGVGKSGKTGSTQTVIDASDLNRNMYAYTLVLYGKVIGSKKIVVIK